MKINLLILIMLTLIICWGCVPYHNNDPYEPYDPYNPPDPYDPYNPPDPYDPYPPNPPDPYPNPHPYPHPYPHPQPYPHSSGRIEILDRDIGGGNMFTPKAKISLRVYGNNIQSISLYAIQNNGSANQLTSASCSNGQSVYLNTKYNRGNTQYLELRLHDSYGRIVARETLSSK